MRLRLKEGEIGRGLRTPIILYARVFCLIEERRVLEGGGPAGQLKRN